MRMEGTKIVYEVGDWVWAEQNTQNDDFRHHDNNGKKFIPIFRIKELNCGGWLRPVVGRGSGIHKSLVRLATQEEINKATQEEKIIVGADKVRFFSDRIEVGCVTVEEKLFLKIGKKAGWL